MLMYISFNNQVITTFFPIEDGTILGGDKPPPMVYEGGGKLSPLT